MNRYLPLVLGVNLNNKIPKMLKKMNVSLDDPEVLRELCFPYFRYNETTTSYNRRKLAGAWFRGHWIFRICRELRKALIRLLKSLKLRPMTFKAYKALFALGISCLVGGEYRK